MKPIKCCYKVWCLGDSDTKYLVQFQIYKGKDGSRPAERTLGEHVVLSLGENVQEGAQLYFDNYFTTTRLMKNLAERGIFAAGTVRSNRKDLPAEIKKDNKLKKGEHIWQSRGPITAYQWKDNKNIHATSNFHNPEEAIEVNRKLSSGATVGVTCPKALSYYNAWVGGVDRFEQESSAYPADHRPKTWWHRIFYYLFDVAVVNAFLQFSAHPDTTYQWFCLCLGRRLINSQVFRCSQAMTAHKTKKNRAATGQQMVGVPEEIRFLGQDHTPQRCTTRRRCSWCSTSKKRVRTSYVCQKCQVPVCQVLSSISPLKA